MTKPKKEVSQPKKRRPPAATPEAREKELIALAVGLAEKQLSEGTASSQVISHFLKLATKKEQTENEILELQKDLILAKTEAMKSTKRVEELYQNALDAMRLYTGSDDNEEE